MQKFEYKILTFTGKGILSYSFDLQEIEATLTGFGLEGWELVSNIHTTDANGKAIRFHYMKREIKE